MSSERHAGAGCRRSLIAADTAVTQQTRQSQLGVCGGGIRSAMQLAALRGDAALQSRPSSRASRISATPPASLWHASASEAAEQPRIDAAEQAHVLSSATELEMQQQKGGAAEQATAPSDVPGSVLKVARLQVCRLFKVWPSTAAGVSSGAARRYL